MLGKLYSQVNRFSGQEASGSVYENLRDSQQQILQHLDTMAEHYSSLKY